jgi:hypothetical protein
MQLPRTILECVRARTDQPWNPRLQLLAELGLGWAAAVPFNLHGDQGIVVYCARDEVDMGRLQSDDNESYLIAATDLIGAAYALRGKVNIGRRRNYVFAGASGRGSD